MRINSWKERKAPEGFAFPGDPGGWEQTKYETAVLCDLRKLPGLEKWLMSVSLKHPGELNAGSGFIIESY